MNTPTPVFYKSVHTKEERHTGIFLAEEIKKIFTEVGVDKFLGLIYDNGANIKLARKLIAVEYPHICHALDLLIGDIFKIESIGSFKKKLTTIVTEIKNSQVLHAFFEKLQMENQKKYISLKLPVPTRWNSMMACLKSFIATKNSLKLLAIHEDVQEKLSTATKQAILDESVFWQRISIILTVLTPIAK